MTPLNKSIKFIAVWAFIIFFVASPVLFKIKLSSNIFIEPLIPLLILAIVLVIWNQVYKKTFRVALKEIKVYITRNKIVKLYIFLMALLIVSYAYGYFLTQIPSYVDFLKIIKFTTYFLIFPLAIYTTNFLGKENMKKVVISFAVVGSLTALFTLIRIFIFLEPGESNFWVYSPDVKSVGFLGQYFDPQNFSIGQISKGANATYGLYLSVIIGIFLSLITLVKKFSWVLFLYATGILISFGAVLYTLSRGAIFVMGLVFVTWVFYLIKNKKINNAVIVLLLILVVEAGILSFLNPQLFKKINSTIKITNTEQLETVDKKKTVRIDSSTQGRVEQWKNTFAAFSERPIFSIIGFGYSTENLKLYTGGVLSSTHSLFLDMWARGSLLALGIMAVIWFYLFKTTISFWRSKDEFIKIFGVVLFGFLVGWFIDNLISGEQFFSDAVMIAFWGIFGFIYALRENTLSSEKNKRKN